MRYVWTFDIYGSRFALVLRDTSGDRMRTVWAPGYESGKLLDILAACWYLKGGLPLYGLAGDKRTLHILEQIREEVPEEYRRKM